MSRLSPSKSMRRMVALRQTSSAPIRVVTRSAALVVSVTEGFRASRQDDRSHREFETSTVDFDTVRRVHTHRTGQRRAGPARRRVFRYRRRPEQRRLNRRVIDQMARCARHRVGRRHPTRPYMASTTSTSRPALVGSTRPQASRSSPPADLTTTWDAGAARGVRHRAEMTCTRWGRDPSPLSNSHKAPTARRPTATRPTATVRSDACHGSQSDSRRRQGHSLPAFGGRCSDGEFRVQGGRTPSYHRAS